MSEFKVFQISTDINNMNELAFKKEYLASQYTVNADGRIANPGKFENEPLWAVFYWELALEGFFDEDDEDCFMFLINEEDRKAWPELGTASSIKLWEDSQGFVHTILN